MRAGGQSAGAALTGFLLEPVHQIDGVEVAPARPGPHHVGGDGDGQVGLTGARSADQDDVAVLGQE